MFYHLKLIANQCNTSAVFWVRQTLPEFFLVCFFKLKLFSLASVLFHVHFATKLASVFVCLLAVGTDFSFCLFGIFLLCLISTKSNFPGYNVACLSYWIFFHHCLVIDFHCLHSTGFILCWTFFSVVYFFSGSVLQFSMLHRRWDPSVCFLSSTNVSGV